jgi:hypothetical protein
MAIAVLFDCSNDTTEQYDRAFELLPELSHQEARLYHACVSSGSGFLVIDVWDSEDAFARFGEVLGPILDKVDLHPVPDVRQVVRLIAGNPA